MKDKNYLILRSKFPCVLFHHFYSNLLSYVGVNVLLIIINLVTSPNELWFYWVTIFWGIAVLLHASKVFVLKGKFLGEDWEEKKTKEIMEKDDKP